MAKMSKSERKALKNKQNESNKKSDTKVVERELGYDADYYEDENGEEIECVRVDFVKKPKWYYDMFRAGEIHYRNNELQAKCSDGQWHAEKDVKSCLAKRKDGTVVLLSDAQLKDGWHQVATSSSTIQR